MICQSRTTKVPMNAEAKQQVLAEYRSGMSLYQVQQLHPSLKVTEIYEYLKREGAVRPRGGVRSDPDEEELERRRDLIKNSWTDEQASKRWVGKSTSRMYEMGHCLSRLIPD